MIDYNDGKWHGWNGGECPVHPLTILDVCVIRGLVECVPAENVGWANPELIAFRVVKAYGEPPKPSRKYVIGASAYDHRETARACIRSGISGPRLSDDECDKMIDVYERVTE